MLALFFQRFIASRNVNALAERSRLDETHIASDSLAQLSEILAAGNLDGTKTGRMFVQELHVEELIAALT